MNRSFEVWFSPGAHSGAGVAAMASAVDMVQRSAASEEIDVQLEKHLAECLYSRGDIMNPSDP